MKLSVFARKAHAWSAIVISLPLLLVIGTGLLLQVRKQVTWVQPAEQKGTRGDPKITWEQILIAAQTTPNAQVKSWDDIDRLDVRPGKGIVKIRAKNGHEVQIDLTTGAWLHDAPRRQEFLVALHEGSWFADWTQIGLFLPVAVMLLGMWLSGLYLFFHPRWVRWRRKPV